MRCCPLLLSLLLSQWLPAQATEWHISLESVPEWQQANRQGPFGSVGRVLTSPRAVREELQLRWQDGGFNAQASARWQAAAGQTAVEEQRIQQLYYDGAAAPGQGWTIGKKVMSWGVGQAYRPLDVVQREDRRAVHPRPLEGVPMLAWQQFSATGAWTVLWQRPGAGRGETPRHAEAVAAQAYWLQGDTDWHMVASSSPRYGQAIGGGFSRVLGEESVVHAAILQQGRSTWRQNQLLEQPGTLLATSNPMADRAQHGVRKAVLGAQWTGNQAWGSLSLLAEAWHDGEARRQADWRALQQLAQQQAALQGRAPQSAVAGNLQWSAEAFQVANLNRDNLLLRAAWERDQRWAASLDYLRAPADGGTIWTASGRYTADRQVFGLGWRQLGGRPESALAMAPVRRMLWLEWRLALE